MTIRDFRTDLVLHSKTVSVGKESSSQAQDRQAILDGL